MKLLCTTEHSVKVILMECDMDKNYMDIEFSSVVWEEQVKVMYYNSYNVIFVTCQTTQLILIMTKTAPTGSAAFQVGGSTIDSAFLLYNKSRTKQSLEKHSIMQMKLQKLMLSITDEISMVSFKQYQQMN